ncbi:MAG: DUF1643 domain-containing protein [Vulcanococcus sp.]
MTIHQQQQGFEGGVAAGQNALGVQSPQTDRTGQAAFSGCGRYRWWLERRWDAARPPLLFIGLNPSRATAECDDPTLRRLQGFARSWGFGRLEVLNLFSRLSASPAVLRRSADPVGEETDHWLRRRLRDLDQQPGGAVWLGWGNGGCWKNRDQQVLAVLQACESPLVAIGLTASGQPRHPLYAPKAAQPLALTHPGNELRPLSRWR